MGSWSGWADGSVRAECPRDSESAAAAAAAAAAATATATATAAAAAAAATTISGPTCLVPAGPERASGWPADAAVFGVRAAVRWAGAGAGIRRAVRWPGTTAPAGVVAAAARATPAAAATGLSAVPGAA